MIFTESMNSASSVDVGRPMYAIHRDCGYCELGQHRQAKSQCFQRLCIVRVQAKSLYLQILCVVRIESY